MKTLIAAIAFVLFASVQSFAASIPVYEIPASSMTRTYDVVGSYGINAELGRAWAEITVRSTFTDSADDYYRAQVPGLSIVGDEVVLNVEGQNVVCAKVKRVGIFKTPVARATKNCAFKVSEKIVLHDDGFEIRKRRSVVVSLETK